MTTYEELCEESKQAVLYHRKLASEIHIFGFINSYLIDQFHQKKCVKKRIRYVSQNELANIYYDRILFRGYRDGITPFSPFPCYFCGRLDSIVCKQVKEFRYFDVIHIYYNDREKYVNSFDTSKYQLDSCFEMTERDKDIFIEHANVLIELMDKCIKEVTENNESAEKLVKERKRFINNLKKIPGLELELTE